MANKFPLLLLLLSLKVTVAQNGFTNKDEAKNELINNLKEGKWLEYGDKFWKITDNVSDAKMYNLIVYKKGVIIETRRVYKLDDKLISEIPYKNGLKNGLRKDYNADGILEAEYNYIDDKISGINKEYYPDGKTIKSEVTYMEGKPNGLGKTYFINGKINEEIFHDASNDSKTIKTYDEIGNLLTESNYKKNILEGQQKEFYENGKPKIVTEYLKGEATGKIVEYDENGKMKDPNRVIKEFYENGKPYLEMSFKDNFKNGTDKEFFKNGKVLIETPYLMGLKNGAEISYYETGKKMQETTWKSGRKNGLDIEYYDNGKIKHSTPYINDTVNGIEREYKKNGNLSFEATYIAGQLNGLSKAYDDKGELYSITTYNKGLEESTQLASEIETKRKNYEKYKKQLGADTIIVGPEHDDYISKCKSKKENKWGLCQVVNGNSIKLMIPMKYDSLQFINTYDKLLLYTWNNGKLGIYFSPWQDDKKGETIPCIYEDGKIIITDEHNSSHYYFAAKKNGKWAWVDWYNGKEKTEFIYTNPDEMKPEQEYQSEYYNR